jgi:hypothetical protein
MNMTQNLFPSLPQRDVHLDTQRPFGLRIGDNNLLQLKK